MAGLCALVSRHLITCTAHLSIELWKMRYINDSNLGVSLSAYSIMASFVFQLLYFVPRSRVCGESVVRLWMDLSVPVNPGLLEHTVLMVSKLI